MQDDQMVTTIAAIPKLNQRQYGTDDQLRYLYDVANRLGLYDAADVIRRHLEVK